MLKVYAPDLVAVFLELGQAAVILSMANTDAQAQGAVTGFLPKIQAVAKEVDRLPLSESTKALFILLVQSATTQPFTADEALRAHTMGNAFTTAALTELQQSCFLMIQSDRRIFFEQARPPFGEVVATRFDSASKDSAAASRCFALDEWTACVFHLMRVLELGLRDLAKKLRVHPKNRRGNRVHLDYADWGNILAEMDKKITAMANLKGTPYNKRKHAHYAQLATDFTHFRDAWRNHVMHARESYDQRDAVMIYTSVSRFMQRIADGLK